MKYFFKEEIEFSRLLRVLVVCARTLVYARVGWAVWRSQAQVQTNFE